MHLHCYLKPIFDFIASKKNTPIKCIKGAKNMNVNMNINLKIRNMADCCTYQTWSFPLQRNYYFEWSHKQAFYGVQCIIERQYFPFGMPKKANGRKNRRFNQQSKYSFEC